MNLIFDPKWKMRIAGFMSGSGTNLVKIIEKQKSYDVALIFTDKKYSNAKKISRQFEIPYECFDIDDFYRGKGHENKKDLSLRPEFDRKVIDILERYDIDLIALAGYMSIVTEPLLNKFDARIINVHPADLSVVENGKRKYTGAKAVAKAIKAGEKFLYSTTHVVRKEVDYGEILMMSEPVKVELPKPLDKLLKDKDEFKKIASEHQDKLKEVGDWIIFPLTLEKIAQGRYALEDGKVFLDGKFLPDGYRL